MVENMVNSHSFPVYKEAFLHVLQMSVYLNLPMGTEESNMIRPTLDHFPNGSRFTPLLIKACSEKKKTC